MEKTRPQRNPVTTEEILFVAAEHFAKHGLAGARMDDIANDAGVNKATIYYRIGDKHQLYEVVLTNAMDAALEGIGQEIEKHTDVEEKLRVHILTLAKHIEDKPCFAALIMRELAAGAEHMTEAVVTRMFKVRGLLSQILEQGVKEGRFRPLNPFLIHMQIIGSLMFYAAGAKVRRRMQSMLGDSPNVTSPLTEAAEELADIILHSVRI